MRCAHSRRPTLLSALPLQMTAPPHLIYYSRQALSPSGRELLSPPFASGSTIRSRWKSATGHYYLVPCLCYLRICRSALARRKDIWLSVRRSMCQPRFSGGYRLSLAGIRSSSQNRARVTDRGWPQRQQYSQSRHPPAPPHLKEKGCVRSVVPTLSASD